eukprot:CAMPEP_0185771070 /NCGR_PEP_ID=MMETSP1174-20130828/62999_1 /TAXON_ID=35687 /ORGANISM="Dictyocha speculum, Strain CCMP1381" /LENGTH=320 /DNA_ID=CAMNT_0028456799 /DNA_START=64 /DNA_END=1026 /DNA_ORIENTATION=+
MGHSKDVSSVAWNSSANQLATGSDDRTARIYDVDDHGHAKQVARLDTHFGAVVQLCWDPTSEVKLATLASGDRDKTVRIWDTRASHKPMKEIKNLHEYINIAWSADGNQIAVGSSVGSCGSSPKDDSAKDYVSVIDVRTHRVRKHKFPWEVNEFCFSPNSKFMLLTTENGTVEVYRLGDRDSVKVRSIQAHTDDCYCLAIDPTNQYLAVGSKDSLVSLWELDDMICLRALGEHNTPVRTLSFSPCGQYLAAASYDHLMDISSVETGARIHAIDTNCGINQVAWQPKADSCIVAVARDTKNDRTAREDQSFVRLVQVPRPE